MSAFMEGRETWKQIVSDSGECFGKTKQGDGGGCYFNRGWRERPSG